MVAGILTHGTRDPVVCGSGISFSANTSSPPLSIPLPHALRSKKGLDQNSGIWNDSFGVNQEYPRLQFILGGAKAELKYQRRDHVT